MRMSIFEEPMYNYKIILVIGMKTCLHDVHLAFIIHNIHPIYIIFTGIRPLILKFQFNGILFFNLVYVVSRSVVELVNFLNA